jgi:hypothetical protein
VYATWNPYQKAQEELAQQLGIQISDYPGPISFPTGYYLSILEKGMNRKEIHTIIRGYEKVYHCNQYSEIYYYFDTRDDSAIRFKVLYDSDGYYKEIIGEEPDSPTLRLDGCAEGQIIAP